MVNLMSVDSQKVLDVASNFAVIWSPPVQVVVSLVFLFLTLGVSILSGLAVMILLTPSNMVSGKLVQKFQVRVS